MTYEEERKRINAALVNCARNIKGWERQAQRVRGRGLDPSALERRIALEHAEERRLRAALLALSRDELAARARYANQAKRVGEALPSNEEE